MPIYTIINDQDSWLLIESPSYPRRLHSKADADMERAHLLADEELWEPYEMRAISEPNGRENLKQRYAIEYGQLKILLINGTPCMGSDFWPAYYFDQAWQDQQRIMQRLRGDIEAINGGTESDVADAHKGALLLMRDEILALMATSKSNEHAEWLAELTSAIGGVQVRCEFHHQEQHWVITDLQVTRVPVPGEAVCIEKGLTLQIQRDGVHHFAGQPKALAWAQVLEDNLDLAKTLPAGQVISYGAEGDVAGPFLMRVDDELANTASVHCRKRNLGA